LLQNQRGFSTGTVTSIAIVYNLGAICGGLFFGTLSGRIGRRRAIALAAALALPALPFWGFSVQPVNIAMAAFVLQFMVQGAWGVVPVHLNELSPQGLRATFPGFVAFALTLVVGIVAVCLLTLALLGPERRNVRFGAQSEA
jgi:SHS family lactate transporter-like MFS transporter